MPTLSSAGIQLTPILSSGLSSPTFVTHAGDGTHRLFITELGGVVKVLQPGATAATVFLDVSARVASGGERGLLGLAFHPQYAANGRFFVYYTRAGDGTLVIAEYGVSADPNVASPTGIVLLRIAHPINANHNGGMLAFGPDGYLYIGVGDGGSANDPPNNAQNANVLLGKILRIDVDHPDAATLRRYSSPSDNPYAAGTGRAEIFSIGWRNPWRFSFDRSTHQQWVADVGQGAREEVDTPIVKGGNYGWRVFEGSRCSGNDPPLCNPADYIGPSSTTRMRAAGARSPAATSVAARRTRSRRVPTSTATSAPGRSSRGMARRRACCSIRRSISRRSARTSRASSMWSASAAR